MPSSPSSPSSPTPIVPTDAALTERTREKRIVTSPRFKDGKFKNTHKTSMFMDAPKASSGASMLSDFWAGMGKGSPKAALPLFDGTLRVLDRAPASGLRLTWLGHSTVLIEIDGVRLLTDPVWGLRASPFSFAGPKRFHPPPVALADLPPIDAVTLSHDHYDHLDASTIRALATGASPGFSGRFVTTLGVGAALEKLGANPARLTELDWSEGVRVTGPGGSVDVTAVPAQHFSGRSPLERDKTLWAGFVIAGPHHKVFFSGDTGPTAEHADIGASFGPFDVALFEIGAYHPSWADIHLGPDAAFKAFLGANARAFLPVHWGTFDLALHAWEEPAETLYTRATAEQAPVWTPILGQPIDVTDPVPREPWWRRVLEGR